MSVLLIGDFLVDRILLVGRPAPEERFSSHYGVLPRNLVDPNWNTDVAGGIATSARVLSANGIQTTVFGCWQRGLEPDSLVPPPMPTATPIQWIPVGYPEKTQTITRVFGYDPKSNRPGLLQRFDRDALEPGALTLPAVPASTGLIVAGDYHSGSKGLLAKPEVSSWLQSLDPKPPILLRSANRKVVQEIPWSFLSVNVHHLNEILEERLFDSRAALPHDGEGCIYHPGLLDAIQKLRTLLDGSLSNRFVLLNLEKHGALLVDEESISPMLFQGNGPEHQGLGATDVLLGHLAKGMLTTYVDFLDRATTRTCLIPVCRDALGIARTFSANAWNLESVPGWYAPNIHGHIAAPVPELSPTSFSAAVESRDKMANLDALVSEGAIKLFQGEWYLESYLTVDPNFGQELVRLQLQIQDYLKDPGPHPFVAAICGEPGAGKSALAECLGKVAGCEFISENAAQWTSPDDITWLLERIRSIHMKRKPCLALIDEVDASPGRTPLYGKLLAPLWDGAYFVNGDKRELGSPNIFLLAGSGKYWRDKDALLKAGHQSNNTSPPDPELQKLPDLVSRFTVPPLSIPKLQDRKADVAYLVARAIKKNCPRVETIQEGVFRLLAESRNIRHGVRSVMAVSDLFSNPKTETAVTTGDLGKEAESKLLLHIPEPLPEWKSQNTEIKVIV